MPSKCSIIGCGAAKNENRPNLTFHKLPKNENKKRMWLEVIGKENLRTNSKEYYICSLHFEESSFNRTLDLLRLRDDAVPSLVLKHHSSEAQFSTSCYTAATNQQNLPLRDIIKEFNQLEEKVAGQKRKIKCLNETIRRQKLKIANFEEIIKDLKDSNMVTHDSCLILEECSGPKDFLLRQISKAKGLPLPRQYSEELRKFALTLHFLSPRAYEFIRSTYNTCLPHPRTLCKWYQNVDAEPGFCKEAFDTLKAKAENTDYPLICALVLDEMSIRKSLIWDSKSQKYHGRVNFGIENESDSLEIASQCLVFLVNCINGKWKLPVAYFLITSLNGEQKASLLKICLQKCKDAGIKIVSVTCDGPAANFSMFQHLGCNLQDIKKTSFESLDDTIYCFIDPCHAIKLIRNAFGELKLFYDMCGRQVNYDFLEKLLKIQEMKGLHIGTKITRAHLYFEKQKMKVRLATQLLSGSVADALEYCDNELELEGFQDSEGTVNFIRIVNDVFDVLNSCSIRPSGWKKAVCKENIGLIEALFESAIGYIEKLKLPSGELLIRSKRRTGFISLIIDMRSTLRVFMDLVMEKKLIKYLPVYKVSQDHIELFFSAIRARGGFNNNPNAVQFRAAFKRLLIRAEIRDGGLGNCIPLEQVHILSISSSIDPISSINDLSNKKALVEIQEDDSSLYEEYIDCLNHSMSKYAESVVTYIAGFVARKISRILKCASCTSLLFGEPRMHCHSLIKYKTRGGLVYPSKDVEDLCKKAEKLLKTNFEKDKSEKYYMYIFSFIVEIYGESNAFATSSSDHDASHKYLLMKSILKTYIDIRFRYFGRKSTEKLSVRNYLNKIVLFRNE